jgi:cobalamin-dependent methionine synthase I
MVEAAADEAEKRILGEGKHRARFSPGYADLPLSFTEEILRLTNAKRLMGITLSDTFLATPSKTVTAIIGLKE